MNLRPLIVATATIVALSLDTFASAALLRGVAPSSLKRKSGTAKWKTKPSKYVPSKSIRMLSWYASPARNNNGKPWEMMKTSNSKASKKSSTSRTQPSTTGNSASKSCKSGSKSSKSSKSSRHRSSASTSRSRNDCADSIDDSSSFTSVSKSSKSKSSTTGYSAKSSSKSSKNSKSSKSSKSAKSASKSTKSAKSASKSGKDSSSLKSGSYLTANPIVGETTPAPIVKLTSSPSPSPAIGSTPTPSPTTAMPTTAAPAPNNFQNEPYTDASAEPANVETQVPLEVCRCNQGNECVPEPLPPGSELRVCFSVPSTHLIDFFDSLYLEQPGIYSESIISNGTMVLDEAVEEQGASPHMLSITTPVDGSFYARANPPPLHIKGIAVIVDSAEDDPTRRRLELVEVPFDETVDLETQLFVEDPDGGNSQAVGGELDPERSRNYFLLVGLCVGVVTGAVFFANLANRYGLINCQRTSEIEI